MQKILIINGAEKREPMAKGDLAQHVIRFIDKELRNDFSIRITDAADGYDIENERQKFLDADIIIYHTPIFWFNMSSALKKYIDDVFIGGVFFIGGKRYGMGGLLTEKQYMLSVTWNAKSTDLTEKDGFLKGRNVDQILLPLHLTNQYVGMHQLATLSLHNVIFNPNIIDFDKKIKEHLSNVFQPKAGDATEK
jgi:modulator of drug activity B